MHLPRRHVHADLPRRLAGEDGVRLPRHEPFEPERHLRLRRGDELEGRLHQQRGLHDDLELLNSQGLFAQ